MAEKIRWAGALRGTLSVMLAMLSTVPGAGQWDQSVGTTYGVLRRKIHPHGVER